MGSVYSKRLLEVHDGGNPIYVVPAGFRTIVRFITGFNADEIDTRILQLVHLDSDITIYQRVIGFQATVLDEMRVVFYPGEQLQLNADAEVDGTVSGYELSLP